jgi:predicted  nucleic acid-binding Zn-ribbon protein
VEKVRQTIVVRDAHFEQVFTRVNALLNKLQIRIDRAKSQGQNTQEIEKLMADARLKLTDAQTRAADVKTKQQTATTKADFVAIQPQFKAIKEDIRAISLDAAKIHKALKGFNSSLNSEGSRSAKPKPSTASAETGR